MVYLDNKNFKLLQKVCATIGLYINGKIDAQYDKLTELAVIVGNINNVKIAQIDFPEGRLSKTNDICTMLFANDENETTVQFLPLQSAIMIMIPTREYLSIKDNGIYRVAKTINKIVNCFVQKNEVSFTIFDETFLRVIKCHMTFLCLDYAGYTNGKNPYNLPELLSVYDLNANLEKIGNIRDIENNYYFMSDARIRNLDTEEDSEEDEDTSN